MVSASIKGTVIRILSVEGGEQLQELRRGSGKALIQIKFPKFILEMKFNFSDDWSALFLEKSHQNQSKVDL